MKNKILTALTAFALALVFCACGVVDNVSSDGSAENSDRTETYSGTEESVPDEASEAVSEDESKTEAESESESESVSESSEPSDESSETPVTDDTVSAGETDGEFSVTTADGTVTSSGSVYTIKSAGTYSVQGKLDGQIIVEAGDEDVVEIELNGVTISCSTDSPIKILSADKVEISAKSGTENVINDTRPAKTVDTDTSGEGAIYAKTDLKLKGTGTLVV